jgi:hypothetical protein
VSDTVTALEEVKYKNGEKSRGFTLHDFFRHFMKAI